MTIQNDPSAIRPEVSSMQARARVCNTLMGGTTAMRLAGRDYLPQEPQESDKGWWIRLSKSALFNAFKDSVNAFVGKPLGQPLTLNGVPPQIEIATENIDLAGRDIGTFARDWFRQSLVDGIGWVLVDYPRVPEGATVAQEQELGARPYFVHIPLANVLGWKTENVGGVIKVIQFRWKEVFEQPDGDFGTQQVERIKVWEPGQFRVFTNVGGAWTLVPEESGPVSIQDVPIVCFAPGRTGFFTSEPPFEDLAWLNVQHWQSSSDQRHILHVARVPLLTAERDERDDTGKEVTVGSNGIILGLKNLGYVEHSGAAINAGRQDLLDIQEQMRLEAGKVMTRQAGGDKSATEAGLEAKDGGSKLRQWTMQFQDCLEDAMRYAAMWLGLKGDSAGGSVSVSTDWDDIIDPSLFTTALQARLAGQISQDSFLYVAGRCGVLPKGVTPEDEKAKLATEGPQPFDDELKASR